MSTHKQPLTTILLPVACRYLSDPQPHWRDVRAELLPIEMHWPYTFAVHMDFSWTNLRAVERWEVSNVETGLSVAKGPTRAAAIQAAVNRLSAMSTKYVRECVMAAPQECRE